MFALFEDDLTIIHGTAGFAAFGSSTSGYGYSPPSATTLVREDNRLKMCLLSTYESSVNNIPQNENMSSRTPTIVSMAKLSRTVASVPRPTMVCNAIHSPLPFYAFLTKKYFFGNVCSTYHSIFAPEIRKEKPS